MPLRQSTRIVITLIAPIVASVVVLLALPSPWPKPEWQNTDGTPPPSAFCVAVASSDGSGPRAVLLSELKASQKEPGPIANLVLDSLSICEIANPSVSYSQQIGLTARRIDEGVLCSFRYGGDDSYTRTVYLVRNGVAEPQSLTDVRGIKVGFDGVKNLLVSGGSGLFVMCVAFFSLRRR
jgi:hypothetical protein